LVSLLVQSLFSNIQNSVYLSKLPNVAYREPFIPLVSVPLTKNVMEQNPTGLPNSMYFHVGLYTPYFGFGYEDIRTVATMWPLVSNPLANPKASLNLVLRIA